MRYSHKMFMLFAAMGIFIVLIAFGIFYNHKAETVKEEECAALDRKRIF